MRSSFCFSLFLFLLFSCKEADRPLFERRTDTGIDFINRLKPTPALNILNYLYYYNGAGIASADFNNDGYLDLYFTANQSADHLYLNHGNWTFEKVELPYPDTSAGWSFGVSHTDINLDGLEDIYISRVDGYGSLKGRNLLLVNQGLNEKGQPFFKEESADYGLDFSGFSTHSAFFDYDLDGDLDLFLLNHSVHPNRAYGKGIKRNEIDLRSGDKILENIDGCYVDKSEEAGIHQGKIGYGLGLSIGDLNNDGYPDIYVGNDFFENDYVYINNGDGTFTNINTTDNQSLGHTTHFSMGNAIADLNNDGHQDIVSLDMLPEHLSTYKTSGNEDPYTIYAYFLKNGYAPQFMQNTFHLNRGGANFSEIGYLSGISATEWSWAVLARDLDMDGYKDLYITNGIKGATNDMDFISFIAQDHIQASIGQSKDEDVLRFTEKLPVKKTKNYAFRNSGEAVFENVSASWFQPQGTFSAGALAVDLDNDGDLDIVVNNTDGRADVFENQSAADSSNYINIHFAGPAQNPEGIGAKVALYAGDLSVFEENFSGTSYLSTGPYHLVIGLGRHRLIDSLVVRWPGGDRECLSGIAANQTLTLNYEDSAPALERAASVSQGWLRNIALSLDFHHSEKTSIEFAGDALIPYSKGHEGPAISVGDINNDGLDDVFIGGAKRQASILFIQNGEGDFQPHQTAVFQPRDLHEDVAALFVDVENDGDIDLVVGSGGNEFEKGIALKPRLYLNHDGVFTERESAFSGAALHCSVIRSADMDNDGDMDLIMGSNTVAGEFALKGKNYIFNNDGDGNFSDVSEGFGAYFSQAGLVEDVAIADFNADGWKDLMVAGHWMPLTLFINHQHELLPTELDDQSNGWWNAVKVADFDCDGDLDVIAGNWGLNSRLHASPEEPITVYRNDFDGNGRVESILTYYYDGVQTTLASKDELTKQLPALNKRFLAYHAFAKASMKDLFGTTALAEAEKTYTYELASCYFENLGNNNFVKHPLPLPAQYAPVQDMETADFNGDGYMDVWLVGNLYEISTQLGRQDASRGLLLLNDKAGFFEAAPQTFDVPGAARSIESIRIKGEETYIVTINNGTPIFIGVSSALETGAPCEMR